MAKSAKIILINYPYGDFQVGDECDFGEEINKSLVGQQRAVWAEPPPVKKVSKKVEESVMNTTVEVKKTSPAATKKLLQNELKNEVKKATPKDSKSFWDRLK